MDVYLEIFADGVFVFEIYDFIFLLCICISYDLVVTMILDFHSGAIFRVIDIIFVFMIVSSLQESLHHRI